MHHFSSRFPILARVCSFSPRFLILPRITLFFSYKNMLSQPEPQKEIEIATNKITTMFLNFCKSEPQRSYKHGSYKKKKVYRVLDDHAEFWDKETLNELSY